MCAATRLSPIDLQRSCSAADLPFETTADAPAAESAGLGQERAVQALRFGVGVQRDGYNIFAIGTSGVGRWALLRQFLEQQAATEPPAADWCYVFDFDDPARPRVLELPKGRGLRLQRDMARAVTELRLAMRSAFESDTYRSRKQRLVDRLKERQSHALGELQTRARLRDVAVTSTDNGLVIAPLIGGKEVDAEQFRALSNGQRGKAQAEMERVGAEVQGLLRQFHEWGREQQEAVKALDRETAAAAVSQVLGALRAAYAELPAVLDHLAHVEVDVVDSLYEFLEANVEGVEATLRRAILHDERGGSPFRRYHINVLVDRDDQQGAPVVCEDNPTYANLLGRIEHESQFGALTTHFTLIRPGAIHRALGGYLIVDVMEVLRHPFAWDALKRAVRTGEVRIESLGQAVGLVPTISLEPEPIPLGRTKVVLVGERVLYYLLCSLDPDLPALFKVLVDFEDSMERCPETQTRYAELVAAVVQREALRPFDRGAVARVIDQAARSAGDAERLSVHLRDVVDLLREADFFAGERGREVATADDVQAAVDAQLHRAGRVRDRLMDAIRREDLLVATDGENVGQVNGLTVIELGGRMFGHPARITARARMGKGEVIDIERQVELGGPIHSKGVLILTGLLGARFAPSVPLSLSATLVFEQSYGSVEGDSASLAELCALLSALAEVPIRQSLAVTGSINQHGRVQSIGGVNEKIEGYYALCRQRGLTGEQGVLVPRTNVKNLMLHEEVVEAVATNRFHVYAVEDVDDALEVLTGQPAGVRNGAGRFPEGSVNGRIEGRLIAFAESARTFRGRPRGVRRKR